MPPFSSRWLATTCLLAALAVVGVALLAGSRAAWVPVALLVVAAGVFSLQARAGRHPTVADTERFIVDLLVGRGFRGAFRLSGVRSRASRLFGQNAFSVKYSAEVAMTEPLYQPTQLTPEMCGRLTPRRVSALCVIAQRLSSELGNRAEGIANRIPPDPFERRYLVASSAQGLKTTLNGHARAFWKKRGWVFETADGAPDLEALARTGLPRAAHGTAVVLDSSDGRLWFHDTMRGWNEFEEEVAALQRLAEAERTERAREVMMRFFLAVRTGAVFHGTAETLSHQIPPTPFFLEITGIDEPAGNVGFTLRNDGCWNNARTFTGVVNGEAGGEAAVLLGRTRASDAIVDGGPLLGAAVEFEIEVRCLFEEPMRLIATSGDFILKLTVVSPDELPAMRARIFPREALVRAATMAGATYSGRARFEDESMPLTLEFVDPSTGALPMAQLGSTEWSAACEVAMAGNRYASVPADLILTPLLPAESDDTKSPAARWKRIRLNVVERGFEGFVDSSTDSSPLELQRTRTTTGQ